MNGSPFNCWIFGGLLWTSWSVHDYPSTVHKMFITVTFESSSWTVYPFNSWTFYEHLMDFHESPSQLSLHLMNLRLMNNHIADQQESWTFDERSWFTMIMNATGSWTLFLLSEEQWWTFMTFMASLHIHNVKKY